MVYFKYCRITMCEYFSNLNNLCNDIHIISCGTVQYKSKNCCSNKACPPITLLYILYIGVMSEYILSCVQDNL